jgi:hypothetical protein
MPAQYIFLIDMALGYLACALLIPTYVWPRLRAMDPVEAHRAIATFNSFRFFGLAFLLPGFVGPNLPQAFATPVAYGDLATALLAIFALLAMRKRSLFWVLVWAFNLVGLADLIIDTAQAINVNLPSVAGQLGAGYAVPMLYVPAFFWTHILAFWLLLRPGRAVVRSTAARISLAATE